MTVPSRFVATEVIRQLVRTSGSVSAIASGSYSLPPAMWNRSSEAPKIENPVMSSGWNPSR